MINIPTKVKKIIDTHINMIEVALPDFLAVYYIYGSISLGAFNDNNSDIDFIAVINRKVIETDLRILKNLHRVMHKKYPKNILDGMYLLLEDVKTLKYNNEISCLRFNDGEFMGLQKFDRDSIDAFQLLKYGIVVKGQEIDKVDYMVDFDILLHKMRHNMNSYWVNWRNDCRKFLSTKYFGLLVSPQLIEWGVLGVTRQYYTFKERDITSKVRAGEYALQNLPQRWHKIIKEAMRLRKNNNRSYYNSIFQRKKDALDYIDFIIQESSYH